MSITRAARVSILLIVILLVGLQPNPLTAEEAQGKSPDYQRLRLFREVMGIVQKNYVKEVTDKELIEGAINGMLQSLDAHSSYLTPELFKELQVETKGEFGGLGIEITLDNGVLTIVSPIEDTPAYKAGLEAGDKIIKIDGESTKNITLIKAVKKMRGQPGTKVTLTIMREGFRKFKDFVVTRALIHVNSIKSEPLEPGYPYIRIVNFQESTEKDLIKAIDKFGGNNSIKGLIIDLRNNPGGLLDQAVKVSQLFVDKGMIVYTDGRHQNQRMPFSAKSRGKHYTFKIAVLINGGSASASEIVAGAMQDHNRAVIFGTKSFGKASVQTIIPLENGSGLRLTTAYYYTPHGRNIQEKGIEPDDDLKEALDKQTEEEEASGGKKAEKERKKKLLKAKVDPQTDLVVKAALEWLKSDLSVKAYKQEVRKKKPTPETAWYKK